MVPEDLAKALENETIEGLLGKPAWRDEALPEASFTSLGQLKTALAAWKQVIRKHLPEHDFNLFGDFAQFYQAYKQTNAKKNLLEFYRNYEAKINSKSLNCTGLSSTLLKSLQQSDPEFGQFFALVSCEENIPVGSPNSAPKYEFGSANKVKRHVLLCLKFRLSQCDRTGYVLVDSGYNVTRPIVVMCDKAYPHTSWFLPCHREKIEERNYKVVNSQYIQWEARNINPITGELETVPQINLIYVEKKYLSYESVTHKRSLLINTKFWVFRNDKGPVAAFVSLLDQHNLTILSRQNDSTILEHFSIDELDSEHVQKTLRSVTQSVSEDKVQSIEQKFQILRQALQQFREALDDLDFCRDVCVMDECILSRKQSIE